MESDRPHTSSWRSTIQRRITGLGFPPDWFLIPLAAIIGALAGVMASIYSLGVRSGEAFFFGRVADQGLIGSRWWLYLVLPASGALLVGIIKQVMNRPLISHGIPEVIEAMARRGGKMTLRSAILTGINSILTLGSGGSTGQEGPIILIGSVMGSQIGQHSRVPRQYMSTLVGCGAAAGLAAIFNAPIAGVLLVLEVILRDFSLGTFMPVVIASVFGVAVNQAFAGRYGPIFSLDRGLLNYHFALNEVLPYLVLGVACGPIGVGLIKVLYFLEHVFEKKVHLPHWVKPATGGLVLGAMGALLVWAYPGMIPKYKPPAFMGNGYPVMEFLLTPTSYWGLGQAPRLTVLFLLLIAAGKVVGTSLTLGSGGSGGMFAPALFIGASVGGAVGVVVQSMPYYQHASPALYALAGMAGVLAAAVHCPLTAIILVFEITRDYTVIMPVMLVAIVGTVIAQSLLRDSVYTQVLRERGIHLGTHSDLTLLRRLDVASVPLTPAVIVAPHEPAQRLLDLVRDLVAGEDFVVCDASRVYRGLVSSRDVGIVLIQRDAVPLMIVEVLIRSDVPTLTPDETLDLALDKFARFDVSSLPVVDADEHVMGVITRTQLMRRYHAALGASA